MNWPAGGDDREKQSFFWFHDHRMDHTGSNVYKGMVGLYPIYDPKNGMDMGDETQGLRLPGVRTNNDDGSFDVEYDIPLAFYDCRLDDGVTIHQDIHDGMGEFPDAGNPRKHPEWWGKTFYKHFPNHGFVGDIFTVNGTAYPVLHVKRRKYRFRFLDASVCADLRVQADELRRRARRPPRISATPATSCRASTASPTGSSACSSPRSPATVDCCRCRSRVTRSSCGRPSAASSSSTSPSTRTARRPPRAT